MTKINIPPINSLQTMLEKIFTGRLSTRDLLNFGVPRDPVIPQALQRNVNSMEKFLSVRKHFASMFAADVAGIVQLAFEIDSSRD